MVHVSDFFVFGKSSQNSPKMCILSIYNALLKVVGYYDLSVLSMSVMYHGFKKKKFGWGVGG